MADAMPVAPNPERSPKWNSTVKLIAGLTVVAFIAALVIQFREVIGPLILAFILAYVLHPIASFLSRRLKLSWRLAVTIVFLVLIVLVVGVFALAGFALIQQIQSLIDIIQGFFAQIPSIVESLSTQVIIIGPFQINLTQFDLSSITNQLLSSAQALLGQVGGLVSSVATSAITTVGYVAFIALIAYFLLADGGQVRENMVYIKVPGYDDDMRRLGQELTAIWAAYLRSQFFIVVLVVISYYILMTALGMRFTFGIALMAGLARFVPYVGPFITWTTTALVAYFQPTNYFGLEPWAYTLLVLGLAILLDQVFDNYIQPALFGSSLGLHPAAILVAAIVAFQWLGFIGLFLAAPVLATVILVGRYSLRKIFDLDPWPEIETGSRQRLPHDRLIGRLRARWRKFRRQ